MLIKSFRLSEYFLFLLIFGQFLKFGEVGCAWWYMDFHKLSHYSLLFFNDLVSTNLYSCFSMETLYFLHSMHSLEKLKKWYTIKSCITKRFWFLKKLQIWQKQKIIRYVSSGSVLPLLHNLSSRFSAILIYAQFMLLPLCDVLYVWSLMVNITSKIRNISILSVFQITEFPILHWT